MNLQQLRYVVSTADEGTMTQAAAANHVAQPALSRAIRALEAELGVTVFDRKGRGVRLTGDGAEVVAIARRILADVDRLGAVGQKQVLRVCAVQDQAPEVAAPTIARYVARKHGHAVLEQVESGDEVCERVRDGRAHLGIMVLPPPPDLVTTSLGWQEMVLVYPGTWTLDDPVEVQHLSGMPLLTPPRDDWRHHAMVDNLRAAGISVNVAAEANDPELLLRLVLQGTGAWVAYGRQATAAVAMGAKMAHLSPIPVREIGIVSLTEPEEACQAFIDIAREETRHSLHPVGDDVLDGAVWVGGNGVFTMPPPPTSARPILRPRS